MKTMNFNSNTSCDMMKSSKGTVPETAVRPAAYYYWLIRRLLNHAGEGQAYFKTDLRQL